MQEQNFSLSALEERDKNNPFAPKIAPTPTVPALPAGKPDEEEEEDSTRSWAELLTRDTQEVASAA